MSTDDGLTEAVQRVMAHEGCSRTWDDLTRVDYCPAHNCGWLSDVDACAHAEAVTQAAREDVADRTRQAQADALEDFAHNHVKNQTAGRIHEDLLEHAATIREGRE